MCQLLLSYDFPPIGGGIARLTGELARRFPAGSLLVSTGRVAGSEAVDYCGFVGAREFHTESSCTGPSCSCCDIGSTGRHASALRPDSRFATPRC